MSDKTTFMFDGCKYELHCDGYKPISRLVDFLRKCSSEYGYEFITNPRRFYECADEYIKKYIKGDSENG